jgi:restriction system protein
MPEYSLEDWRAVMRHEKEQPSPDYLVISFPNDQIKKEYLEAVSSWPELEIRQVLRAMLGESRGLSIIDEIHIKSLIEYGPQTFWSDTGIVESRELSEYECRAILALTGQSDEPVWQGLTWVLDLLPKNPREAINAISAYLMAHAQSLPDLRIDGLSDSMALVRSRYIVQGTDVQTEKLALLRSLDSRDVEYLAAALYSAMGYRVRVTKKQKDGGFDVVAENSDETIYIECKNWEDSVGVEVVRGFTGVVLSEPVTRGVLLSVSGFTERGEMASKDWMSGSMRQKRVRLLSGSEFIPILNEFLGADWHIRVDRIISNQKIGLGRL